MTPLCVSLKDAAEAIGVSQWVVRHYIATGLLPVVKLPSTKHPGESNRRVLISVADLEKIIAAHREVAK